MLSRVRTYTIKGSHAIDIQLSYESGCDCVKLMNWLHTAQGHDTVRNKNSIVFSLGTNDEARHGNITKMETDEIYFLGRHWRSSYPI